MTTAELIYTEDDAKALCEIAVAEATRAVVEQCAVMVRFRLKGRFEGGELFLEINKIANMLDRHAATMQGAHPAIPFHEVERAILDMDRDQFLDWLEKRRSR